MQHRHASKPRKRCAACALPLLLLIAAPQLTSTALAQSGASRSIPAGTPRTWADAAAANQIQIINADARVPLRYRVRKIDARGSTTREVIESRDGNVARLIERDGAPLTPEEDSAERDRLHDILASPERFLRRQQRERASRGYALELVRALPQAMVWSFASGQPQPPNARSPQVVLDFLPAPGFNPPTLVAEALTGIAGRVWIDANTRCVTRIEARILRPVNIGFGGLLARVSEGGTLAFEQSQATDNRWVYSHLSEHLTVREVLVHTVHQNTDMDASDVHALPAPMSFREAVRALLTMQVPTR